LGRAGDCVLRPWKPRSKIVLPKRCRNDEKL
jgi:hypothetical protein